MNPDLASARLGQADVIPYLLEAALLEQSAVDQGRVRVVDASRRNAVFLVTSDGSAAHIVKQARRGGGPASSVRQEFFEHSTRSTKRRACASCFPYLLRGPLVVVVAQRSVGRGLDRAASADGAPAITDAPREALFQRVGDVRLAEERLSCVRVRVTSSRVAWLKQSSRSSKPSQ
jgi:hypothetical protein